MFQGVDYQQQRDFKRLESQLEVIKSLMSDTKWRSLEDISLI